MTSLVKIDGVSYDALVTALEENFTVIEGSNSGHAIYRNREIRDITGVKIGHTVTFSPGNDPAAFDTLCNYLFGTVRQYVTIEAVHGQTTICYNAAYNTGARRVAYIDSVGDNDTIGWDDLTVEFRAIETQINPG